MFDIRDIRDNPQKYDTAWARRGLSAQTPSILSLDESRRSSQTELQDLQNRRKILSKEVGEIKSKGGNADALMAEVSTLKDQITALEGKEAEIAEKLNTLLSSLPNILLADVPDGKDEHGNVEMRRLGEPNRPNNAPDHVEIGEKLDMMDFETAAKLSGSRFVMMHSGLARLERALAQMMLDTHIMEHGYTEVSPPLLVRSETMYGTGQLPKFEEDQFRTTRGDWLIPTAEVPLTNIVADSILDDADLPRRYTAWTPCFRQEAGAAGRDTRGMIRQHQFYKVEMVSIVKPEDSSAELERMVGCAENILKKLELPYRVMALCSGDIGFGAMKTYDLEVWLPSQNMYREISSCSNCGDFQARRMKARFKRAGEKDTTYVHTLNGSGLAVGRALVAILENFYDPATNTVHLPSALHPYMGGMTKIEGLKPQGSKAVAG